MLEILKSNEIIWLVYVIVNYILIIITYKFWGKKGLMMLVPISIIIANVQVNKLVTLFGTQVALGNIAYSSIYVISDILTENYGANESKKLVGFGFFTMIFTSIVMQFALIIKPSESDINHVHLQAIFTMFLRFTIASIIAFVLSSYTDILIYQNIKKIKPGYENIWIRNNASTLLSQIVDNLVFSFIAFLGVYPIGIIISIILSTYFLKIITSIIDTPFVYLATYLKRKDKIREI